MHPSINYRLTNEEFREDRVLAGIVGWQIAAVFLIAVRTRVLNGMNVSGAFLNLPGQFLWNMVLVAAVDMLVLPPMFAFTRYVYGYPDFRLA